MMPAPTVGTGLTLEQFVVALMRHYRMGRPTRRQLQLLEAWQSPEKREILCAFRGLGKSTIAAMAATWELDRNPDAKILFLSASGERAEALAEWVYNAVTQVPWLAHLSPDSASGRYSKIRFDVGACRHIEQSPSVRASGILGQITGSRANIIVPDDVETPATALTQVQRQKLRNNLNELEAILKPEWGFIRYLGTPHSSTDSIYFYLRRTLNYRMVMWPARVPEKLEVYNGALHPSIAAEVGQSPGAPTDDRFSDIELKERQQNMSPMQWRLQFMLDPTLSDVERYPLRCGDLMVTNVDQTVPEVVRYEKARRNRIGDLPCPGMAHDCYWFSPLETAGTIPISETATVMALDPSGGGADEFAWAVVRVWAGNYFLVAAGGARGGFKPETKMQLATLARDMGVNQIVIETNFGGLEVYSQVFKQALLDVGHRAAIEPFRSNTQKERRIIDTLAPILQNHRMVVDRRVVEADYEVIEGASDETELSYSLFFQLTRVTYDRGSLLHDDRLDALAMACQWYQEQAALDQEKRAQERRQAYIEACLEDESSGRQVMTAQRMAMGMDLETARRAHARAQGGGSQWLTDGGIRDGGLRARPGWGRYRGGSRARR